MALKKAIVKTLPGFTGKLTAANAYFKIEQVFGNKLDVSLVVGGYVGDVRVSGETYNFTPDMEKGNFIAQGYDYLKTLPEFSEAVDS